jgi:hypothetical protein
MYSHYRVTKCLLTPSFLGAFAKLRKATVGFATSVLLPARRCPEGSMGMRLPYFKTTGTWSWQVYQPYTPAAFTPRKYFWYSFLIAADSTPGPECDRKDNFIEKFQWHHQESNPRRSGLQHSATTNRAIVCPILHVRRFILKASIEYLKIWTWF